MANKDKRRINKFSVANKVANVNLVRKEEEEERGKSMDEPFS